MLIRTCNAMKTNHKDQLHVQHTTNAKYTKYLHLGIKILLGHKSEVLKTYYQYLKIFKKCYKHSGKHILNIRLNYKNKVLKL